jgi:hypothetical protein
VIGAQSLSPTTWLAGLWRPSPPRPSSSSAGGGSVDGVTSKAAVAITAAPSAARPAAVSEMPAVVPAMPSPVPAPRESPTHGVQPETPTGNVQAASKEPADPTVALPARVKPPAPLEPTYREAVVPRDLAVRTERRPATARRVEPPAASEEPSRRPAPTPTPAPPPRGADTREAPDPSAIIDWVFRGNTGGSQ